MEPVFNALSYRNASLAVMLAHALNVSKASFLMFLVFVIPAKLFKTVCFAKMPRYVLSVLMDTIRWLEFALHVQLYINASNAVMETHAPNATLHFIPKLAFVLLAPISTNA
jgi:hypothetical protein